jgi:hypothetical protein
MANTNETAEPSGASAGSHGEVTVSVHTDDSACAFPDSRPIRRQRFTLTDAEREAVECGIQAIGLAPRDERTLAYADMLRGLLERTK